MAQQQQQQQQQQQEEQEQVHERGQFHQGFPGQEGNGKGR